MSSVFGRFTPTTIAGQIAMLVVASIVLAHLLITATFFLLGPQRGHEQPEIGASKSLAFLAMLIDSAPDATRRAELLQAALKIDPTLKYLTKMPQRPQSGSHRAPPGLDQTLKSQYGDRIMVVPAPGTNGRPGPPELMIAARLMAGGARATTLPPPPAPPRSLSPVIIGTLIFLASAIALLTIWAVRALIAPLTRFADNAERFTLHSGDAPLAESGPSEIRRLATALNGMQDRIRNLVEARTRMLAAVSHDLRTPITRMRLRSEEIGNSDIKAAFIRDLESMQYLVQSCLSFLRDGASWQNNEAVDLSSLVQTVCDESDDIRQCISFCGKGRLYVNCDPEQLKRAVVNVIDNALKHGEHVSVQVGSTDKTAMIEVADDGPGIPDAEKRRVLEPFYRGDTARDLNQNDSYGLGLSIAQSIVDAHHGSLELRDADPRGLIVTISLPLAAAARGSAGS